MRKRWQRWCLVGLVLLVVVLVGWGFRQKYQYYLRIENAQREAVARWLREQSGWLTTMDQQLTQVLLGPEEVMRSEALQGAVTAVERAYGQLAVAPFTPPWRNDYMLNTMLHYPWGPIIDYFAYVSQLQGILPHGTRASLHELRQWALATKERAEALLDLVYGRDWQQVKDTPLVQEAFDSWLEQMALQEAGEQDEGYQAHRRGRAKPPQSWPGLWYSGEARITEAEALARAQEFL